MKLRRNFKYRIYPTPEQDALLRRWEGVLRFLWNIAHEQRLLYLARPKAERRRYLDHYEQSRQMTELLSECPWIGEVQCQARQEVLADLHKAWERCFKGLGKRPRFKRREDAPRIYAPTGTVKATLTGDRTTGRLSFAGPRYAPLGALKIVLDRPIEGAVKGWTLKREGKEWYAVAGLEIERSEPVKVNEEAVGIDRGVALFLADSTGRCVENPHFRGSLEARIARAQRAVDRKKRGSKNQHKARERVAKLHRLAARRREVFVHTESLRYAASYGTVVVEKLNVTGMTASAKGTVEAPGKNVKQKAGLNRAILDVGWGKFADALKYKVEERGGHYCAVNPAYTSQTCPTCGHVDPENRPAQAEFHCQRCGYQGNADVVAAINVKRRGVELPLATPKEKKTIFRRGRKPKTDATVKPTVEQPVEASSQYGGPVKQERPLARAAHA